MVQLVALMCVYGLGSCFALLGSTSVKLMPRLRIDQGKFVRWSRRSCFRA